MEDTMLKSFKAFTFAFGSILILSSAASAKMSSADVLRTLHDANQAEIQMGKLAQTKGATDDVKNYGKSLEKDHANNDEDVVSLASKTGVALKSDTTGLMDEVKMKLLNSKNGAEFDKAFAKCMIDDHKNNIEKLQKAQAGDLSKDVKELVAKTLGKLQEHLETAQKIYGRPS